MFDEEMHEEEMEGESSVNLEKLNSLGISLSASRSEAINGRQALGIEDAWIEDEEHYEGVDDANRGEMGAWRGKPYGQAMMQEDDTSQDGSTVFINITRPYVDASSARVADMLLPTDDRAWEIKPTPVPEMAGIADGNIPESLRQQITSSAIRHAESNMQPGQDPRQMAIAQAEKQSQEVVDEAAKIVKEARDKSEKATKRIEDWQVECQFHAEVRAVIEDSAKVGTGVLKGPIPAKRKSVAYINDMLEIKEEIKPISKRVSYWNIFPDPACGENAHNGAFIWEKDDITSKQLMGLIGAPGYITEQIEACLKEGAHTATKEIITDDDPVSGLMPRDRKNLYEIWYYHGRLDKESVEAAGCECGEKLNNIDITATMVNNKVIRVSMNHLDTGDFPYDFMVWQKRKGMPYGTGVSRHIRTPQRVVNGAARNMMDNAGIAGGPQLVIKAGVVEPADGVYEIRPRKIWQAGEDADLDHLDNAFRFVTVPMIQGELQAIIQLGMKLAEDVTGLPMLMQGQMGQGTPDTVGGMNMLQNNASTVLRRLARLFDDLITEPHIRRYYNYLLQYGDDDSEKGDFQIDARGSSALMERETQHQQIMQMAQIVSNPIFGVDPKKWLVELLKSQRLDFKRFEYDDEEWKKVVQQMSQPPKDSSVEVATIRAQVQQQSDGMKKALEEMKIQMKAQTDQAKIQSDAAESDADRQLTIAIKEMEGMLEQSRQDGDTTKAFEKIKADLADTAMRLKTQRDLALQKEVIAAPSEPPGRAPNGQAFQA